MPAASLLRELFLHHGEPERHTAATPCAAAAVAAAANQPLVTRLLSAVYALPRLSWPELPASCWLLLLRASVSSLRQPTPPVSRQLNPSARTAIAAACFLLFSVSEAETEAVELAACCHGPAGWHTQLLCLLQGEAHTADGCLDATLLLGLPLLGLGASGACRSVSETQRSGAARHSLQQY